MKIFIPTMIIILCLSCQNKDDVTDAPLKGTKWKLVGFVAAATGKVKEAEPASEKCYLLTFNENGIFTGVSSTNQLMGTYVLDNEASGIHITNIGGTEINELFDGKLYVERLAAIQSFAITKNSLKLYYNVQKDYLLFNKQQR